MEKRIAHVLYKMIGLIVLIALGSAWQWDFIAEGVMAHVYTTGSILSAFGFAIVMAFVFVFKLRNEVVAFNALKEMWDDIRIGPSEQSRDPLWRHYRCSRPGRLFKRPRLLGHAYDLVTDELARTKKIRLSVETMNTLVHKIGETIDDEKSLLGYMSGLLVFMGLIGTFIGLLHMVGSMGGIIGELASSAGGSASPDAFQKLLGALQEPLKGMASGFAASLFGLFSSLVVGLLARMAGQAAGVLRHEFESWLAGVVQIGDEENANDRSPERVNGARSSSDHSLVQTVGSILADYSRVAGNFDQAVRLLGDIQMSQQQQAARIDTIAGSLSKFGAGLETFSEGMSVVMTTELEATRLLIKEMEQSHSTNIRHLANNHAQTAVQIAAAIEKNAFVAERMPLQVSDNIESRIDGALKEAMKPLAVSITSQFHRLEDSVTKLATRRPADGSMSSPNGAESGLEGRIFEGFDRLNANIGTAFSAYTGVLKLAVSALEKAEGASDQRVAHPPEIASTDTNRAMA
ncbi:hypothetical protein [Tardiphaga sp.]|uniref:hypothetical protein n=1 Tax=Tardiphaga sp. TaxID=1926292 RepID=UPI0025D7F403|nr:hypothetical protein [Tardiphaga sp.]